MAPANQAKRLYKSRTDRMIDGICGGVAEYFGLDPTLVRIAWVLLTLLGGSGIVLYIVAMIVMPANPGGETVATPTVPQDQSSRNNSKFWGILLVVVGIIWLMNNFGIVFWRHWWGISWDLALPLLLILAGVAFLFGGRNYVASQGTSKPAGAANSSVGAVPAGPQDNVGPEEGRSTGVSRLYRSRIERKLFGVCGGIGNYMNIDPTLVRLLFVIAAFASFGFMVLLYIIMAIVVPEEPLAAHVS